MENKTGQLEALHDIRKMMKDSSKFLSLSGLAGVFAGVYALVGAFLGHALIVAEPGYNPYSRNAGSNEFRSGLFLNMLIICGVVLILSLVTALILSKRKAKKINQRLFDATSKKVFWCMAIPLGAGGLFCIAMILNGPILMVSAIMLLFYGLALVNSSKYTMPEVRYLGYLEIAIGLLAAFLPGHGLFFWALGFGVLHIIYGSIMWYKYDRLN